MAKVAASFLAALEAIAFNARVFEFGVTPISESDEAAESFTNVFTKEQTSDITDWIMTPDAGNEYAMYEVSSGDAHIGYILITNTVYYQTLYR